MLVAFSVIGAGLIHLAAIRSHLASPMAVASFTGIGLMQILLGASLLQPGALAFKRLAVLGVGFLAVGAWFISRTWGFPAVSGHTGPEPFGAADLAAAALQLVSLFLILVPDRASAPNPRRWITGAMVALPVVTISAVASFSLLSVPGHGPVDAAPSAARSAASKARPASYGPPRPLTKRAVPVPPKSLPTQAGHKDASGTAPHGH